MRVRGFALASVGLAAATIAALAAGCGDGEQTGLRAGVAPGGGRDIGGARDGAPAVDDGGAPLDDDAGDAEARPLPPQLIDAGGVDAGQPGAKIVDARNVQVIGTTSDGWVVYADDSSKDGRQINAVPLDGGSPSPIAEGSQGQRITTAIVGKTVFAWTQNNGGLGPMSVWQNGSLHATSSITNSAHWFGVSADGTRVIWAGNYSTYSEGDIFAANVDLSDQRIIVRGVNFARCPAQIGFAGNVAVVEACIGQDTATVWTFDPDWTQHMVLSDARPFWATDATGTFLFAASNSGMSILRPLAGGLPFVVDDDVTTGQLTPDGRAVVYITTGGALKRAATNGPEPATLVPSGVSAFADRASIAPDGLHTAVTSGTGANLQLASTLAPGPLAPVADEATLRNGGYTADSAYAVVIDHLNGFSAPAGQLWVAPTDAKAAPTLVATYSTLALPTSGSGFVFTGDGAPDATQWNIYAWDAAGSAGPRLLVNQARARFALGPAKDRLVYAAAAGGIYVAPLP